MHIQLGRQRQAETGRDKQRYIQRYIHGETDICREWAFRGKELYTGSAIQAQIESYCCIVTQERQAYTYSNMQMHTETCRD